MHKLIALLVLAACTPPQIVAKSGYRDTKIPIYSNAVLESGRLDGDWAQVAAFAGPEASCPPSGLKISAALAVVGRLCVSGEVVPINGTLRLAGPGRFALDKPAGAALNQTWWVLWADVGYRTLVIGTPSGEFGFILNRDGALPSDRKAAAAEVLAFNGYDPARLRVLPLGR